MCRRDGTAFPASSPLRTSRLTGPHQKEEGEEARDAGFRSWLSGSRGALGAQKSLPRVTHGLRKMAYYTPILQLDTLRLEAWRGVVTHSGPHSWVPKKLHPSTEAGCSADSYGLIKGQAQNRVPGTRRSLFRSLNTEQHTQVCIQVP